MLPSYVLLRGTFCVIITLTRSNSSTVLVSSSYKTLLEILLNLGLNLTIFRGTGPWLLLLTLFKLPSYQTRYLEVVAADKPKKEHWKENQVDE